MYQPSLTPKASEEQNNLLLHYFCFLVTEAYNEMRRESETLIDLSFYSLFSIMDCLKILLSIRNF